MLLFSKKTKWIIAVLVTAGYFLAAWWFTASYEALPKHSRVVWLEPPFEKLTPQSDFAFIAHLPKLNRLADDEEDLHRSPVMLYESGRAIGIPHSDHLQVAKIGNGLFSHWRDWGIIFSTSDNSDPNTNGRRYRAVLPD